MSEYKHSILGVIRLQRRAGCKRISICVGRSGKVTVTYPWYVLRKRALAFVEQKVEWIAKAQAKASERSLQRPIESGYSTRTHTLRIVSGQPKQFYKIEDTEVIVGLREDYLSEESQQYIRTALIETLRHEAHTILPTMVEQIASIHGFRYNGISIKNIRSKWASCSATNHLNFSVFLMRLPDELIRFVILHELCHTIHKNHSPKFHALLNDLCGGQESAFNKALRQYHTSL